MLANLGGIRAAVFAQQDWAPTQSSTAVSRVDEFINRAVGIFCAEAPFAFGQKSFIVVANEDFVSASGDGIRRQSTDEYVFERTTATTSDWSAVGLWDGRMLEVTLADGTTRHFRIRNVWFNNVTSRMNLTVESPALPFSDFASDGVSADTLAYRIYDEGVYLPADVVQVQSVRMRDGTQPWYALEAMTSDAINRWGLGGPMANAESGVPTSFYRLPNKSLPAPLEAPTVGTTGSWGASAIERAGTFNFVVTAAWGRRDRAQTAMSRIYSAVVGASASQYEPLWESLPSPVSAAVTPTTSAVTVTATDLEIPQGFGGSTTPRYGKSGWYWRVYRKRTATDGSGTGSALLETSDKFYLIGELTGNRTADGAVTFDGTMVPDYNRPLRYTESFPCIGLFPRPDRRYELEARAIVKPDLLVDDRDAIDVQDGVAINCIVDRTLMLLYEMNGAFDAARLAERRYLDGLKVLRDRYGMVSANARFRRGNASAIKESWPTPIRRATGTP